MHFVLNLMGLYMLHNSKGHHSSCNEGRNHILHPPPGFRCRKRKSLVIYSTPCSLPNNCGDFGIYHLEPREYIIHINSIYSTTVWHYMSRFSMCKIGITSFSCLVIFLKLHWLNCMLFALLPVVDMMYFLSVQPDLKGSNVSSSCTAPKLCPTSWLNVIAESFIVDNI